MRLAAICKLGYYPAAPEVITELVKHLRVRPPDPDKPNEIINLIDPCCGEGLAVAQIAQSLDVAPKHVYAVELDAGRAERAKSTLPGGNVLGPASFLGVQITGQSFGLAYVNSPFDDELGGGKREEQAFAERATRLLVPKGILLLVCPIKTLCGNREFCGFLDAHFDDVAVYKFPDGHRPYNEIVFIGKKRRETIPLDSLYKHGSLHRMGLNWNGFVANGGMNKLASLGECQPVSWHEGLPSSEHESSLRTWEIPRCSKPSTFKKTAFTEAELLTAISSSPLNGLLGEVIIPPPLAPPLPLDKGHLGLILASGMLNGIVAGPHGIHVVRGSSHKVEYHNKEQSTSEENPETGAVTTKEVFSQKMVTVIRCVEQDGVIVTFSNDPKPEDQDVQDQDE